MTFYESQRWHSGEKRGFRLNVRRVAAAAAFASAEHFQSENALRAGIFAPAGFCGGIFLGSPESTSFNNYISML
ncbi:hypothetical protein [Desulfovibrio sp. ZJ200]|uniref:hypothetical protein n=1 Tax=Desulfovibrio sp. ZJ200 TaxID=2709792 RepID=UPI0013ED291F|nr:hypothetical protein [Desulfovibrio sp. ZJ200]